VKNKIRDDFRSKIYKIYYRVRFAVTLCDIIGCFPLPCNLDVTAFGEAAMTAVVCWPPNLLFFRGNEPSCGIYALCENYCQFCGHTLQNKCFI